MVGEVQLQSVLQLWLQWLKRKLKLLIAGELKEEQQQLLGCRPAAVECENTAECFDAAAAEDWAELPKCHRQQQPLKEQPSVSAR